MHRFDEAWRPCIVIQRFAQFTHEFGQASLTDDPVRPDRREQRVLGEEDAGIRGQVLQQRERFRPQLDHTLAAQQHCRVRVEPEGRKR